MNALAAVEERIAARREKWTTSADDILPDWREIPEVAIIGTFSICGLETRRRMLLAPKCVPTPLGLETPPSLARDYLMVTFGGSPRAKHAQIEYLRRTAIAAPQLARPTLFQHGYYVDLKAAYWNIMLIVGWDCDYWPGRWLSARRAPSDFPWPLHKLARNCLLTAGISSRTHLWYPPKNGKPGYSRQTFPYNPLANLQLPRLAMDVLNSIAAECADAGAVYVNTDGYIAPNYETLARLVDILASWELPFGIKLEGPGWVQGSGTYGVGATASKRHIANPSPIDTIIRQPYAADLKAAFTAHARNRKEAIEETNANLSQTQLLATTPKGPQQ